MLALFLAGNNVDGERKAKMKDSLLSTQIKPFRVCRALLTNT